MTDDGGPALQHTVVTDEFFAGMVAGVRRYAWWNDGVQFVGTCGTALTEAMRKLDREYGRACPHSRLKDENGVESCGRCGVVASDAMLAERKKKTSNAK
jgi:hypothetical protein